MFHRIIFLLFIFNNLMAADEVVEKSEIDTPDPHNAVSATGNHNTGITVGELLNFVIALDQNTSIFRTHRSATPSLQHIGIIAFLSLGFVVDAYQRSHTYCPHSVFDYGRVIHGWTDLAPNGLPYSFLCISSSFEYAGAILLPFSTWFAGSVVCQKVMFYLDKRSLRKRNLDSLATEDDIRIVGTYLVEAKSPLLSKLNAEQVMYLFSRRDCFNEMENLFDDTEHKYLPQPVIETLFTMARMSNPNIQIEIDNALSDDKLVEKFGHIGHFCNLLYALLLQRHMETQDLTVIRTKLLALTRGLRNGPMVEKLVDLSKKNLQDLEEALADERIVDDCDRVEDFCHILRCLWPDAQSIGNRLRDLEVKHKKSK